MQIPLYQVDAFTDKVFRGNPAAVCLLQSWLEDEVLQSIAAENNLSETAFLVGAESNYQIRWFTPNQEVDLCGHATLASGHVVMNLLNQPLDEVSFESPSGELRVRRDEDRLQLDFPSRPPETCDAPDGLIAALGCTPIGVFRARDHLVLLRNEDEVIRVCPNFERLRDVDNFAVVVTAAGSESDFVSRFFAPAAGVPEDPVTGSAHCTLVPFWAERLGRVKLTARQVSTRGGTLFCELLGDRVLMSGNAVRYLEGTIHL
ncbi:MAG: PhzF family phenazine biosynthesis protein [bacterium]|nr:PhzF family phenazine biosynthesis protein [bacterium]